MGIWTVRFYNELDSKFGYDVKACTLYANLSKAVAKSIARHLSKNAPEFMSYWAESLLDRI